MIFKLKDLKETPKHFEYCHDNPVLKYAFNDLSELSSSGKFPMELKFDISLIANTIHLVGNLTYTLYLTCGRCVNPFHSFINDSFDLSLLINENTATEEIDNIAVTHGMVDLKSFFHDRLALNIPFQPLCHPTCKGLCPNCGQDLNLDACKCPQKIVPSRFSLLENISINRKKGE